MTKVAIMGYGVVGSGLIELIDKNRENNGKNEIIITSILVRDKEKHISSSHSEVITTNVEEFFSIENDVVIEVMGGLHPAYDYVKKALSLKKHVITANKDLIATFGHELFQLAKENNVSLKFEAAVAGGIPIIKPLTESLYGNGINSIKAILNGTTNFILTKMDGESLSYEEALKEAQELGFAEANPESDVMGYDAARKLAILSSLAFDKKFEWNDISIEGITDIDEADFKYANKLKCKIKLVAEAFKCKSGIYTSVKPILVDEESILAKINNEVNAVILNGDEIGELLFVGKGAGKLPTGSAVYSDLNDIINSRFTDVDSFNKEEANVIKFASKTCNCILRIKTLDREEVINRCRETFNNIKIIDKTIDGEVAIYIECTSEAYVEKFIEELQNENYYKNAKKLIVA
ncbi:MULTISPECIES: homoserine dehydrogenase [unclassified Clostridium]|uniref:homoserine dehydrogenase n=1 Tax=Clostridium TaxID=1485 RepID=UPI001C8C4B06|nr:MULTISPECIES: homoserine dehydrogenase [unclassified Clostridium]MBX9137098.1 homoserine dehydrogenase [Clostridium sp. K12(2020)]MBX9143813.1 homoserine dehydrogenase [Clostridium sp. K13]MDU2288648.1 homoserine dehydrogenase [Clostridium celatum]